MTRSRVEGEDEFNETFISLMMIMRWKIQQLKVEAAFVVQRQIDCLEWMLFEKVWKSHEILISEFH